ncbi:MAG: MBL fold metallo-hydrolase [Proteobacteria bacterium]|nr:MBL fold metallo-hydrolase [Pseudomonadota bacterium]
MKKGWPLTAFSLVSLLLTLCFSSCSSSEKQNFSEGKWAQSVNETSTQDLYAPHEKEGRFFAPWMKMGDKSFLDVLGWKLFSTTNYTDPERTFLPRVLADTAGRLKKNTGDFILWIGHNTFLIRVNGIYWLTDPIFSKRALLPARLTPPALTLAQFNALISNDRKNNNPRKALNILISHNHYDHLDRTSMTGLPASAVVFVPKGLKDYVMKMNKPQVNEMDWWETIDLGDGTRLICLPAQHWSLRINQGRNRSLWVSYLLVTPKATLYFGGDSGYFKGFREIGRKFPNIDYAFMATTAYHPRWFMQYQHMNVEEAVRGFEEMGARYFIPTQWGTFHLGVEPAGYPGLDLGRHIEKNQLNPDRFKIMDIGQIIPINGSK